MSDDPDLPSDRDMRAGEYVLGLGDAVERRAVEREMGRDAGLAHAVAAWERRLEAWLGAFRPVSPPRDLWERVSRSAFDETRVTPGRARPGLRSRLAAGVVGFALAAGIAFAIVVDRPSFLQSVPSLPVAALMPKTAGAPVLLVWRDQNGSLLIRSVGALAAPSGKDYELWSLPADATQPVALGVLLNGKATVAAGHAPTGRGLILVSLEARGGSPTGRPQGPVLWSGSFGGG